MYGSRCCFFWGKRFLYLTPDFAVSSSCFLNVRLFLRWRRFEPCRKNLSVSCCLGRKKRTNSVWNSKKKKYWVHGADGHLFFGFVPVFSVHKKKKKVVMFLKCDVFIIEKKNSYLHSTNAMYHWVETMAFCC